MKLNISQKISLLSVFLIVLTAGAVSITFYKNTSNTMVKHALEDLTRHVGKEGQHLRNRVDNIIKDIHFVAQIPPIQGIIRTIESGGIDKEGNSTRTQWEQRLTSIFSTLLHAHPDYMQARFINEKGYELVRVERNSSGNIIITPENSLQNKSKRTFVKKTVQLQKNKVYLSEINLNREYGKVIFPHIPVLRAATPIYTQSGDLFGLVVINMDLSKEFQRLYQKHYKLGHTLYLTNDRGDYLIHPDNGKRFAFDFGNDYKAQDEYPHLVQFYMPGNNEKKIIKKIETDNFKLASVFVKIPLPIEEQNRYVVMGMTLPFQEIIAVQNAALSRSIWLSLVLITIGVVLAYGFSIKILHPIKQISSRIDDFMHGKTNRKLPTNNNDEIGMLARTFETLIEQVTHNQNTMKQLNERLEKKVVLRTHELSRFKTTLDLINDSVFIFDPDSLKFTYVNQGATNLIEYSRDELLNMTPVDLQHAFKENDFRDVIEPLKQGKESHLSYQTIHIKKTGEKIPVELFIQYVTPPGEKPRFVILLHDITLRKEIEKSIINAKHMAEKANKSKSEFLARMSHELRTPMNAILGFGQLMKEDEETPLNETHKIYNEEIMKAGYHLLDLINEVLDLAKIESGKIEIENELFDCHEVTLECLSLIKPLTNEKELTVEYKDLSDTPAILNNDKKRLREVLLNLLSNAVKYNKPQGSITLTLEKTLGNCIRIKVTDTGNGLTIEQQEHLFNPFDRIGAEYSDIEGSGIGLVIVKRLVETMGGTLGFESTPGTGSTFYIEFELSDIKELEDQGSTDANVQQLYPERTEQKFKILYIEDNKTNMQLVEHALKKYKNINLLTSTTPNDGLLVAAMEKPDLILLDINLPIMDGYEVLRRLHSNNETGGIPVIAISAYSSVDDQEKGKQAGFNDYLTKPIELQQLYNMINHFLPDEPEQENKIS